MSEDRGPGLSPAAPETGRWGKESSLHRALKFRYAGEEGRAEEAVGKFVCDALTPEGEFVEVQTGSFRPLVEKAKSFCALGKMRIIHPICIEKFIEVYDQDVHLLYRRKSPKRGTPWELFKVLLYAPLLPLQENLTIELALVDMTEQRIQDGKGSWRRRGQSILDRNLWTWRGTMILSSPEDYRKFIPFEGARTWTTKDLSEGVRISPPLARKCLYVLEKIGLVKRLGKEGRSILWAWAG